jgi:hypothetical protein
MIASIRCPGRFVKQNGTWALAGRRRMVNRMVNRTGTRPGVP